jgi:hypothetical protein
MRNERQAGQKTDTMVLRSGLSILTALGLLVLATTGSGCSDQDRYEQAAAHHAAARLAVDEGTLRVTERSELSTDGVAVFRITDHGTKHQLIVAVPRSGRAVLDSSMPDAFATMARSEQLGARLDQLGSARVAGWFGAFGGVCGEPLVSKTNGIDDIALPDGRHEISFRFAGPERVQQCHVVIDGHGMVESATTRPVESLTAEAASPRRS